MTEWAGFIPKALNSDFARQSFEHANPKLLFPNKDSRRHMEAIAQCFDLSNIQYSDNSTFVNGGPEKVAGTQLSLYGVQNFFVFHKLPTV